MQCNHDSHRIDRWNREIRWGRFTERDVEDLSPSVTFPVDPFVFVLDEDGGGVVACFVEAAEDDGGVVDLYVFEGWRVL